jgi:hypothetical protein
MPPIENSNDVVYKDVWACNYLVEKNAHGSSRIICLPGLDIPKR